MVRSVFVTGLNPQSIHSHFVFCNFVLQGVNVKLASQQPKATDVHSQRRARRRSAVCICSFLIADRGTPQLCEDEHGIHPSSRHDLNARSSLHRAQSFQASKPRAWPYETLVHTCTLGQRTFFYSQGSFSPSTLLSSSSTLMYCGGRSRGTQWCFMWQALLVKDLPRAANEATGPTHARDYTCRRYMPSR